ncbi:MAG: glycosyltransferase family protein [Flavobacteriaceae bacterium]|nr:glycosyltransferase family protein [Flavobacteriaceae bacterium]
MMTKTICIVQARMSSTRLPGKVLLDLGGKPVLQQVFNQISNAKLIDKIVLATSIDSSDDLLEKWAKNSNNLFYRGSLNNVLERYYYAAKEFSADVIVRITADCPLVDPKIIDSIIELFNKENYDYCSNTITPTFPDGLDVEVLKFVALEKAYINATLLSEIEHVTPYIKNNPQLFKIGMYSSKTDYSSLRWTLDNKEDYEFLKLIFNKFSNECDYISWEKAIKFLANNESISKINSHISRDVGYSKSLLNDKEIEN